TEIVMYTCSANPREADPEVRVRMAMPQQDGSVYFMDTIGHGMIFETGQFDRATPVYDEEGRTAGTSKVARSRAIFHAQIQTEMTASVLNALLPFQGPPREPTKKGDEPVLLPKEGAPKEGAKTDKKPARKKAQPPPEPYKTVVTCSGPAIFDMAYVPRQ